jgi:hypothetical protein
MDYGVPCVIRKHGQTKLKWAAFESWDEHFMMKEMNQMKVHVSDKPTTRLHSKAHPFSSGNNGIEWKRPYIEETISSDVFFSSYKQTNTGIQHPHNKSGNDITESTFANRSYFGFFSPLHELSENIQNGVGETWSLGLEHRPVLEVNMWIGLPGVSTPLHYDGVHNSYVQVSGFKRFVLMSPSAWKHVHLFPKLHPSSRMSQLDMQSLENELMQCRTTNSDESISIFEVTLQPGDLLYIPPFWFHHVSTVSESTSSITISNNNRTALPSISVSVHSDSVDMDVRDGTTGRIGGGFSVPIWGGLTQSQRVAILTVYLDEILTFLVNLEADMRDTPNTHHSDHSETHQAWTTQSFVHKLLSTRYSRLGEDKQVVGLVEAMEEAELNFTRTTFRLPQPMDPQLMNMIKSHAQAFIQWRKSRIHIPQSVWEIMLQDYIEDVCGSVVGSLTVPAYLKHLSAGGGVVLSVENDIKNRREVDISLLKPERWDLEGPDDLFPVFGDTVTVHYSVYLASKWPIDSKETSKLPSKLSMEPFDSSRGYGDGSDDGSHPFSFKVGGAKVVAGLERAVLRMKLGHRVEVFIPSGLAYGSLGVGDGSTVPPYADLIFDIELLSISKK